MISKPLTDMLRKDAFHWTPKAARAFDHLKHALCHSLVLALPNFQKNSSLLRLMHVTKAWEQSWCKRGGLLPFPARFFEVNT